MHLTSPIRGNGVGFHVEYARYCFEERSVVVLWASVRVEAEAACFSPILAVELPAAWVQVGLHGNHGHFARKKETRNRKKSCARYRGKWRFRQRGGYCVITMRSLLAPLHAWANTFASRKEVIYTHPPICSRNSKGLFSG